jgi:uncharacterized RDD family membrane protein YckC
MPRYKIKDPYRWFLHLLLLGVLVSIVVQLAGLWRTFGHPSDAVPVALGVASLLFVVFWLGKTTCVQLAEDRLEWFRWGWRVGAIPYTRIVQVRQQHSVVKLAIREPPARGLARWMSRRGGGRPGQWWLWVDSQDPHGLCWLFLDLEDPQGFLSVLRPRVDTSRLDLSRDELGAIQEPIMEAVCADRWRRFLAFAFDAFALVSLLCTISLASVQFPEEDRLPQDAETLLVFLAWVLYLWVSNATGVSAGKFLFGIRVTRADRETAPGAVRGFFRAIAVSLSLACLGLGYLWSLWDRDRRAWHDMLTGTRVVQATVRRSTVQESVEPVRL